MKFLPLSPANPVPLPLEAPLKCPPVAALKAAEAALLLPFATDSLVLCSAFLLALFFFSLAMNFSRSISSSESSSRWYSRSALPLPSRES